MDVSKICTACELSMPIECYGIDESMLDQHQAICMYCLRKIHLRKLQGRFNQTSAQDHA